MQNDAEDTGYSCGIDMRNAMMDVDTRNPILHFGVPMSWPSSSMKQSYLKRETCAYVMMERNDRGGLGVTAHGWGRAASTTEVLMTVALKQGYIGGNELVFNEKRHEYVSQRCTQAHPLRTRNEHYCGLVRSGKSWPVRNL